MTIKTLITIPEDNVENMIRACRQAYEDTMFELPEDEQRKIECSRARGLDIVLDRMASGAYDHLLGRVNIAIWDNIAETGKMKIAGMAL